MFAKPLYVFKQGEKIVENGTIQKVIQGATHTIKPEYDQSIEQKIRDHVDRHYTVRFNNMKISDDEMAEAIGSPVRVHACRDRLQ